MPSGPAVAAVSLKRRTQDAWGVARRGDGSVAAAWVIDGATPLGASDRRAADEQVSRFAWALSAGLRDGLSTAEESQDWEEPPAAEIAGVVERARARAQRSVELGWPGTGIPTATLSLIRRTAQGLETFVLGDSPLWIDDGERILECTDPQFVGSEQRVIERWQELRSSGRTPEQAYAEVLRGQEQQRRTRSTENGLWVLGESPRAVQHAAVDVLPGIAPRRVCLFTDGLERVVDPFGITDRRGLFEALHSGGAGPLAQRLRARERADQRRTLVPRLTTHDDVTGLAVTL